MTANPHKWVQEHADHLFSLAMLKTRHRETAEDLVQETFLSAIKNVGAFRGDSSERTWLVSILNNKIIDYYRKKDVLKDVTQYFFETEDRFYGSFFHADEYSTAHWKPESIPLDWEADEGDDALVEELQRTIGYCLQKMPSKLVPVFVAKYIEEEDSDKICKDYNISSSNYWVIIHRARLLMRSCLEKIGIKG